MKNKDLLFRLIVGETRWWKFFYREDMEFPRIAQNQFWKEELNFREYREVCKTTLFVV